MLESLQREGLRDLILAFAVALIAGSLMVSRFRYLSGKDLDPRMRIPVAFTVLVPLGFVLVGSSPPEMLFALFAVYASSGPLWWAWRRIRRGRRTRPEKGG
jgi:CDP-diacylglycerol--serine O-phosphatidyltransferase